MYDCTHSTTNTRWRRRRGDMCEIVSHRACVLYVACTNPNPLSVCGGMEQASFQDPGGAPGGGAPKESWHGDTTRMRSGLFHSADPQQAADVKAVGVRINVQLIFLCPEIHATQNHKQCRRNFALFLNKPFVRNFLCNSKHFVDHV